jgi:hypothetical protein
MIKGKNPTATISIATIIRIAAILAEGTKNPQTSGEKTMEEMALTESMIAKRQAEKNLTEGTGAWNDTRTIIPQETNFQTTTRNSSRTIPQVDMTGRQATIEITTQTGADTPVTGAPIRPMIVGKIRIPAKVEIMIDPTALKIKTTICLRTYPNTPAAAR